MKIYGKTFLYFGSSLKTVWLTRDARRGGVSGGNCPGRRLWTFASLARCCFAIYWKIDFKALNAAPCKKSACLRSHKSCGFSANQHGLKHPLPQAHPSLLPLSQSGFLHRPSFFHTQCQFLSSSQLSAWLCRTLLPLKKGKKKGSWKSRVSCEADFEIPYAE